MNSSNKVLVALVAVAVVAFGAYYLTTGSAQAPSQVTEQTTDALPPATDSVDDFAAAMQADVQATASAIQAFDADVDASVSSVQDASNATNLYDPNNL